MSYHPTCLFFVLASCATGDCGKRDTGSPDTGEPDTGSPDTSTETGEPDTGSPDTSTETGGPDTGDTATCEERGYTFDVYGAESTILMDGGGCWAGWSSEVTGDGVPDLITACSDDTNFIVDPTTLSTGTNVISTADHTWFLGDENVLGCDLNGDGYGDIVATSLFPTGDNGLFLLYGFEYRLAYGPIEPTADGIFWDASFEEGNPEADQRVYLDCMGDMDGDGTDSFLFQHYNYEGATVEMPWTNMAFLHEGPAGTMDDITEGSEAWFEPAARWVGTPVDVNGDGFLDQVWTPAFSAMVEILYGPVSGELTSADADIQFGIPGAHEWCYVDTLSDWDLDGYGDFIAQPREIEDGFVFVPSPSARNPLEDLVTWRLIGGGSGLSDIPMVDHVTEVRDASADGRPEVLVSHYNYGATSSSDYWPPGRAWLIEAPGEGVECLDDVATVIYGSSNDETFGLGRAATGDFDFDFDGGADLVLTFYRDGAAVLTLLPSAGL